MTPTTPRVSTWTIQAAPRKGRFAPIATFTRMVDAVNAYESVIVRNGNRKRLFRNGRLVLADTGHLTPVTPALEQAQLPLAL